MNFFVYLLIRIFNQILLSVGIMWIACVYMTSKNSLLPTDPANTESKAGVLRNAPIFRIPYPCNKILLGIRFKI